VGWVGGWGLVDPQRETAWAGLVRPHFRRLVPWCGDEAPAFAQGGRGVVWVPSFGLDERALSPASGFCLGRNFVVVAWVKVMALREPQGDERSEMPSPRGGSCRAFLDCGCLLAHIRPPLSQEMRAIRSLPLIPGPLKYISVLPPLGDRGPVLFFLMNPLRRPPEARSYTRANGT